MLEAEIEFSDDALSTNSEVMYLFIICFQLMHPQYQQAVPKKLSDGPKFAGENELNPSAWFVTIPLNLGLQLKFPSNFIESYS